MLARYSVERRLIQKFAEIDIPEASRLREQFALAEVSDVYFEDNGYMGYVEIDLPESAPPLESGAGFPLRGWYIDADGVPVIIHLFIGWERKSLIYLQFWRPDLSALVKWPPDLDSVRLEKEQCSAYPQTFDPVNGWSPAVDMRPIGPPDRRPCVHEIWRATLALIFS
jgi:hypothetical protein